MLSLGTVVTAAQDYPPLAPFVRSPFIFTRALITWAAARGADAAAAETKTPVGEQVNTTAKRLIRTLVRALPAAALSLLIPLAFGQARTAPSDAPRFAIKRFVLEGNTLLKPEAVERIVAPYAGEQKDFSNIQHALESVEQAYRDIGYGMVQVTLPEQDITQGEIRFKVNEVRVGKVRVEGNAHFDETNIRRSLPALREGVPPNSRQMEASLAVANENPAKQTTVLLRSAQTEDEVDAIVKVVDDKFWKVGASIDNTGNASTGVYRLGTSFQHANLFNRDHSLTAQFITSPGHYGDVKIYGVGYHIPLYSLGSSIDIVGGYSNVNSGTVQNLFTVSGAGTILGLRYNQNLTQIGDYEHKLVYGFDYRAYQNPVQETSTQLGLVPDITVHPVSVYYAGAWRLPESELSFYAYVAQNVFPNGNDASDSDFKAPGQRAEAKASYRLYRYFAHYTRAFASDWQMRLTFNAQDTRDALVAGEQFGLGGADNVRGFFEREISNDRGYRFNAEIYTPDVGGKLGGGVRARLLAFVDSGTVARNRLLPGESSGQSIASAGLGVRLAQGTNLSLRADFATVLDPGGTQNRWDQKLHFLLSYVY